MGWNVGTVNVPVCARSVCVLNDAGWLDLCRTICALLLLVCLDPANACVPYEKNRLRGGWFDPTMPWYGR